MARDPYCRNCNYSLKGLTESSKCPECGQPIVEVLERGPAPRRGRRYKSEIELFGLPLVHIAQGPYEDEPYGKARGIIAIGDQATGWLAIGGFARGVVAIGGMAIGIVSFGGCSVGALAIGGWALGLLALGGGAIGGVAVGGGAIGYIAQGGGAWGYYVQAGGAFGTYVDGPRRRDPEAVEVFKRVRAIVGAGPADGALRWFLANVAVVLVLTLIVALPFAVAALLAYVKRPRAPA